MTILQKTVIAAAKIAVKTCYRFSVPGAEAIPAGGAIVMANHASFYDPLFLAAALPGRPLLFMDKGEINRAPNRRLLELAGVCAVDYDDPADVAHACKMAQETVAAGGLVCVFPERAVTRTGFLNEFKDLLPALSAPVVPVYIDLVKRSGKTAAGLPAAHPSLTKRKVVTVIFGAPLSAGAAPALVRGAVEELGAKAYEHRGRTRQTVGVAFIGQARRQWSRPALIDTTGARLSFGRALAGSVLVAGKIKKIAREDTMVGVLLPASIGGVLANAGIMLAGKVPVNLNFTSSAENIGHAVASCRIKKVVTSKKFASRIKGLDVPAELLYLEDIMRSVTAAEKLRALLLARLAPARVLSAGASQSPHDCATVVFSSGSTAHPKGIVLTHHNIISNIEQMSAVLDLSRGECMIASLPFFHSFGLTASLWFPLLAGFRVAYHPNPLEASTIASLSRTETGTILLATPTFLQAYLRKAAREDFAAMRIIISGAEKLKPALADAFREKFGKDILEGYGATELSPVAALNVPDAARWGLPEAGRRAGTIGRLLPGMAARIVDPDTGARLGAGVAGLFQVRGPNVMKEYLDDPEKTREALRGGWYGTGDIAAIADDGYITITDRLARFSKIGGEMIPHGALEDVLTAELQTQEPAVAVTAVADPRRGEKLVVLYTAEAGGAAALQQAMAAANIPNLWKPAADAYLQVPQIPMLGTGKTDLKGIKALAVAAFERKN